MDLTEACVSVCMGASVCLCLSIRGCMCVCARVCMYINNIILCMCFYGIRMCLRMSVTIT